MNNWEVEEFGLPLRQVFKKNKINKDRFCKKNNLGHGRYGPHIYGEKNRCINCNKINPILKKRDYTE